MRWLWRRDERVRHLRRECGKLGNEVHDLRRQLGEAKRDGVRLGSDLKQCRAARLWDVAQAAAADRAGRDLGERLRAAEARIDWASAFLRDPSLDPAEGARQALEALEGDSRG